MRWDAPAEKVLFQLKTKGPQAAAQVARKLGITAMAVRQHLYRLREQGLVDFTDERRRVGRPRRIWRVTEKAAARFPDSHAELTLEMIRSIRALFGETGLDRLISERTRQQIRDYRERMRGCERVEDRVAALAAIRREQGYMAEWSRERDGSLLLVENHCPICAAARSCQGLCREELRLFEQVLGGDVCIERTDHILAGARRCAYRIVTAPRASRPGSQPHA
jgi:predicted ArsR family transcriptional regulator